MSVDDATPDSTPSTGSAHPARQQFPIIGIGASAGGLEAFGTFFQAMPPKSGMAFVLVQHLPPERESLLVDILAKQTLMPVSQVTDGLVVEPDHVYVIRPGNTMTINNGRLELGEPVQERGHRRPVDDFFRSLAKEQGEKSIAIILSGMGSNGTAGAQEIKSSGGICLAQDPESAQFSSMPQSLIDAGYADHVLRPSEMPDLLLKYTQHPYMTTSGADETKAEADLRRDKHFFNEILALLRTRTNYEFSGYKKPTLHRRIQRRMGVNQIDSLANYVPLLRANPQEIASLAMDLMINVTGFFRDEEAWEAMRSQVVAPLVAARPTGQSIRVWISACATGEEAYTMAMLIAEEADKARKNFEVKIFATDAAEHSLANARAGIYAGGIEGDVSVERLDRFFDKEDQIYRVKKEIREMVVFAPHNLLNDPPFSRLDIVTCRNLLIYLEPDVQRRVISVLHFSLQEGGCLFLGNSETIGTAEQMFQIINKKCRLFRKVGANRRATLELINVASERRLDHEASMPESSPVPSLNIAISKTLLERYTPPAVVIDRHFKISYFHGATQIFLSQPMGEPTSNLLQMCGDGLRAAVRIACRKAMTENRLARVSDGRIDTADGPRRIQVAVSPLGRGWAQNHFLVCFEEIIDAPPPAAVSESSPGGDVVKQTDIALHLEGELRSLREELQSTIEEMESSNEELKASNEEVTSINEELQSTNEELETGKEELQSLNEELTTVNQQLQSKIEELEATTNDLSNLLSSTSIAVVFLDTRCRIRRYTPAVKDLMDLIPSDIGRPLSDLAQKFTDTDLMADAQAVLDKLIPIEREVCSHSQAWYVRRALPYRTADNRIDGVVITFVDITERKKAEEHTRAAYRRLQAVLEQMPAAVLLVDAPSGKLILVNQEVARMFRHPFPFPFVGAEWTSALSIFKATAADGHPYQLQDWPLARSLKSGETIVNEEIDFDHPDGSRGTLSASAAPVRDQDGQVISVVAAFWDITDRKRGEVQLMESEERFRLLVDGATDYAIFLIDSNGRVVTWNRGGERLMGYSSAEIIGKTAAQFFTPEDRAAGQVEQEMSTAEREGSAADIRWHLRKDGSRFWAHGAMTRLDDDAAGKPRGFVKVLRDDTDAKHAADALRKAKQDAEETREMAEAANRTKDDFVATVSHELRTPLSAILLWAKMLRSDRIGDEELRDGLDIILRSAASQQQLIEDLLDVSRMTTGKLRITMRATNIAKAVNAAVQAIKPIADGRGVTVTSDLADVGVVRADPDRLQQVVWNLLNNAVKFTLSGGKVHLKLERQRKRVVITVADTGIGIRKDFLPKVFDQFSQAESGSTRNHTGLGLGLTIARQLVELHNGTITVASEGEGKGTTFTVSLPLLSIAADLDEADAGTSLENLQGEGLLTKTRVLLVEDEPDTRDAVQVFLERMGANVFPAASTSAALTIFSETKPDLIVSDIAMPGEDGYSLIRQIRALEKKGKLSTTPALAMTAFARDDDRERSRDAGFDDHLSKPVEPATLIAVIAQVASESLMEPILRDISILQDKQRLTVLKRSGLLDSPPEDAFDRLTRIAAYSLGVPIALVSLVDDSRQFFKSQVGLPEPVATVRETPLTHSFCQHVVITEKKLVITDARLDPRVRENPIILDLGVIAYAGFPLVMPDGEVLGSFCAIDTQPREWSEQDLHLLEDLAAVVMSEISQRRAKETAEAANRAKNRFLAMLSHELRTPLSPALLISAAMAGDATLPASAREDARTIQRNVQQQRRLIDDLLDLTRIENGKLSLQLASLDLHELLTETVAHHQSDAAAKGLTLTLTLLAKRHRVEADAGRLRQVFSNLLRNAIKFTAPGGRIIVESKNVDAAIEVFVADTGIGMDPSVLPKIFDAFEQGSRSITDEFSGLGLGLAITRGLVEAHAGTVQACSEGKNCGSRMTVTLPTIHAASDRPAIAPAVSAALDQKFTILLVDDHKDTLRAMSRLLQTLQHKVTAVDCMTDALAAADKDRFDLLISDLDLPDGTGLDLMRQVALKQPIRGIALTGYGMEEDLAKSKSAGFEAHLVKPINFKDLALAIQQTRQV